MWAVLLKMFYIFPKVVPNIDKWKLLLKHSFDAIRWNTSLALKLRMRKLYKH